ncbi:MAG: metallophosphoesterase [bacterium]|nr:metallophosphoesterase [bacterium]
MAESPTSLSRFDCSLLPAAELEFVIVADTHYMMDPGDAPLEFESRRKQGRRAGLAWKAIGALDPGFVVHLGDMVQEFPGRPAYEQTMQQALAQIEGAGLWDRCHFVVGNHDIGDRPDPTMPTGGATAESHEGWQARFGPSWHAWESHGLHFIVLNSQLFNTDLPATQTQRLWFEQQLTDLGDSPFVLFLHMPPYLHNADEPWLGHYDNLGEPDRGWLLSLVRRHKVVAMFTGHVHFQFFDHLQVHNGLCRYFTSPSTSFTRPGFSHLFAAAPPPEQGRDDVPKTGFFLCRLVNGRFDVHRIRMSVLADPHSTVLLTSPAAFGAPAAAGFALGVSLRHPLALETAVPVAWPSVIRQPVRNDYPLLACVEGGVQWVRVPVADLLDPGPARRLQILRAEGIAVQAVALGEAEALAHSQRLQGQVDRLELQLPGRRLPDVDALRRLADGPLPLALCPVLPGQPVPGKQHNRTRHGYLPDELTALGELLESTAVTAAAVCRIPEQPWQVLAALLATRGHRHWEMLLLAEAPGVDPIANAGSLARALVVGIALDAPLFAEPLVDMDRTMDVAHGLLDTLCNPRPTFELARCAVALAQGIAGAATVITRPAGCEVVAIGSDNWLLLPQQDGTRLDDVLAEDGPRRVCRLTTASVSTFDPSHTLEMAHGPLWIYRMPA